jgi:hypothetical protein
VAEELGAPGVLLPSPEPSAVDVAKNFLLLAGKIVNAVPLKSVNHILYEWGWADAFEEGNQPSVIFQSGFTLPLLLLTHPGLVFVTPDFRIRLPAVPGPLCRLLRLKRCPVPLGFHRPKSLLLGLFYFVDKEAVAAMLNTIAADDEVLPAGVPDYVVVNEAGEAVVAGTEINAKMLRRL